MKSISVWRGVLNCAFGVLSLQEFVSASIRTRMACPLRRKFNVSCPERPTNSVAAKECADRLAAMKAERLLQDRMWDTPSEQKQQPLQQTNLTVLNRNGKD